MAADKNDISYLESDDEISTRGTPFSLDVQATVFLDVSRSLSLSMKKNEVWDVTCRASPGAPGHCHEDSGDTVL